MKTIIDFKYRYTGQDMLINSHHIHDDGYEILFVHSGSGNIVIKDKLIKLVPGNIYFIDGSQTHCTIPDNPEIYCRSLMVMQKSIIDNICKQLNSESLVDTMFKNSGSTPVVASKYDSTHAEDIFRHMNACFTNNDKYIQSVFVTSFISILNICIRDISKPPISENCITSDILNYINAHLTENILLKDICDNSHISKFYLCHTFKKNLGMTISEYILSRRISEAKRLLSETHMPISEISDNCGFSSVSYFCMMFKRKTGVSPSKFR